MADLLLAIPVFNERNSVRDVIYEARRHVSDVLVIDDGSTDGTTELLQNMSNQVTILKHPHNLGYGQALINAFKHAFANDYEWIITMDCDEQHEPRYIQSFVDRFADGADIISGSRYLSDSANDHQAPPDRQRINQVMTSMVNTILGFDLTDTFCGFKAYRVTSVARLDLTVRYAMPMQLWVQAFYHGLRVTEIPVPRIYLDLSRQFGGDLDDAQVRLEHYLDVLASELARHRLVRTRAELHQLESWPCR